MTTSPSKGHHRTGLAVCVCVCVWWVGCQVRHGFRGLPCLRSRSTDGIGILAWLGYVGKSNAQLSEPRHFLFIIIILLFSTVETDRLGFLVTLPVNNIFPPFFCASACIYWLDLLGWLIVFSIADLGTN